MKRWLIHSFLFVATFGTATLLQGPVYAATIMTILLGHELGHYFMCRKYGVAATFPVFIPMINALGTLGAVIAIKSPIPSRRALFDIGVAGPLVGLALAIPAILVGLQYSPVLPVPEHSFGVFLGEPLLFQWLSRLVLGELAPGYDVYLHPIAFAGWAALFVTAINLFPVGQLDGGHVLYAIFGPGARRFKWLVIIGLAYLGYRFDTMWFIFLLLVLILLARHPAPIDDQTPLDRRRIWIGVCAFLLMVVCFSPVPFEVRQPKEPSPSRREPIFTKLIPAPPRNSLS